MSSRRLSKNPFHKLNCETERKYIFRTLILSFYPLVFLRHFPRMLRLVVFSSKTKSYQEQKTREIAMAKPAKVILNKSSVELSLLLQCTTCIFVQAQSCNFEKLKDLKQLTIYLHQYFCPFYQFKLNAAQKSLKKYRKFMNFNLLNLDKPKIIKKKPTQDFLK